MGNQLTTRADAQVVSQTQEVRPSQGFCEDIGHVVRGPNTRDFDGLLLDQLPNRMEFDPDVFDRGVASLILGEAGGSIVIAVQRGRFFGEETDAVQELA